MWQRPGVHLYKQGTKFSKKTKINVGPITFGSLVHMLILFKNSYLIYFKTPEKTN
jgi:hypothetical protein